MSPAAPAEEYPSVNTPSYHIVALRGVLKTCRRLGLMNGETYHRAADISTTKASTLTNGRSLDGVTSSLCLRQVGRLRTRQGDEMPLYRFCYMAVV